MVTGKNNRAWLDWYAIMALFGFPACIVSAI
jgi:hypothetical protein